MQMLQYDKCPLLVCGGIMYKSKNCIFYDVARTSIQSAVVCTMQANSTAVNCKIPT